MAIILHFLRNNLRLVVYFVNQKSLSVALIKMFAFILTTEDHQVFCESLDKIIEIKEIAKLSVNPDEVLMIKVSRNNAPINKYTEYLTTLRDQMKELFPESRVMVYDDTIDISIVEFK